MRECYARGPVRGRPSGSRPSPARAPEAKLLHVPVGSPLMLVERTAYDEDGTPVEYAKERHRGDRTTFVIGVADRRARALAFARGIGRLGCSTKPLLRHLSQLLHHADAS